MTAMFLDPATGTGIPFADNPWRAPSGRPLMVTVLDGITRDDILPEARSIWRYGAAIPGDIRDPVTLGEGCTPLLPAEFGGNPCHFKLEWFSPTGSFKDRGAAAMISFLRQQGVREIIEDSSGNGGAAIAAYAAAAGMKARILVPEGTQPAKLAQTAACGADIVLVPGPREATEAAALEMAQDVFYAGHNWHPFFLQGTKTIGYEIWEDLDFRVPDNIIIPVGAGSSLLGCHMAFRELMASGETDRMPRLFASQPRNCCPVHAAFQGAAGEGAGYDFAPTVAQGTSIRYPLRLPEMLHALGDSDGGTVAIGEQDILRACHNLAAKGLYVDPSCAHTAAGLSELVSRGIVGSDEETVVLLTGSGLKATDFYSSTSAVQASSG